MAKNTDVAEEYLMAQEVRLDVWFVKHKVYKYVSKISILISITIRIY